MALPKVSRLHVDDNGSPTRGDPFELMLVHMMPAEAKALDAQQGGEKIDERTGLREYSLLAPIYETAEVQNLFLEAAAETKSPEGEQPPLSDLYKIGKSQETPFHKTNQDKYPPVRQLEDMGRYGDSLLVWLPKNMVILFGLARGGLTENPKTGLFEFGFFNEVGKAFRSVASLPSRALQAVGVKKNHANELIRGIGTVGGFLMGGPLGAAAGRTLAGYATGQKPGDALKTGATMGALGYGAQHLPSLMASMPSLGTLGGGAAAAGAGTAGGTAARAAGAAGAAKAASGASGLFGNLGGVGALMAAQQALGMLGQRQEDKRAQAAYDRERRDTEEHLNKIGVYDRWAPPKPYQERPNQRFFNRTSDEVEQGIFPHHHMESYKKGGGVDVRGLSHDVAQKCSYLIKGAGKGQDDKIKTHVPSGSYIIDATSTSMLGDGSSDAGALALQQYLKKTSHRNGGKISHRTNEGNVPVYLSNDEFVIMPHDVDAIGGGQNDKGSFILKGLVKQLRKHKRSNGDRLPPRAKSPERYAQLSRRI